MEIKLGNTIIPVEEYRSARYRRITLSILQDRVRISAPKSVSARQLKELLREKEDWILEHWQRQSERQNLLKKVYVSGEKFLYKGQALELRFKQDKLKTKTPEVRMERQVLWVILPCDFSLNSEGQIVIPQLIAGWYKNEARKLFKQKLDQQALRMGVSYQAFRLKDQKTRWGSCSSRGNINLNWRIVMAPEKIIDYLVIHELAHLIYPNHSAEFWQRVGEFMPDYRSCKSWLREHGSELVV